MGEAFLTKRGDYSDQRIFARISVTYPEGSICTCSNSDGSKILKDISTTGKVIFNVTEPDTWTIFCTDGSDSKNKSVSITTKNQVEYITIIYDYLIFDNGIVNDITWEKDSYQSTSVSNIIEIYSRHKSTNSSSSNKQIAYASTQNTVDLTKYNKLYFVVTSASSDANSLGGAYTYVRVGISDNNGAGSTFGSAGSLTSYKEVCNSGTSDITEETIFELDISSVGKVYVKVAAESNDYSYSDTASSRATVTKIYAI